MKLTEEEHELLKLGPRFIFNDPKMASRRRVTELATLKRKIESRFYDKKVRPGRPVSDFIAELDVLLQNLHDSATFRRIPQRHRTAIPYDTLASHIQSSQASNIPSSQPPNIPSNLVSVKRISHIQSSQPIYNFYPHQKKYNCTVKRLIHRFRITNTVLRKTDKSKVFHLGRLEHYEQKSEEYMEKTKAYCSLGKNDPLPSLIERTNKYLLGFRLSKWITQKQYEQLCVNPADAELAHLYYLPKAHKPGTPLRPIMSGLRHPTLKISKFLDDLLRPLFDQMAAGTTIADGFQLLKELRNWSITELHENTIFCTIDVFDLYTMIPQIEGVLSLKKMLDFLDLKQVGGLRVETIIRLARFVMQNNYFSYNGQFYHQIRGGAMGSPLTLTIANCYMFFYERDIVGQVQDYGGFFRRYIDDILLAVNWSKERLLEQVSHWNDLDPNIKLRAAIGTTATFLDLHIENQAGQLHTSVFHKPSYEPYYLPFTSIHPMQMKRNIPFVALIRAIRYCSTFQAYLNEREKIRMALLLNKYPGEFIDKQFNRVLSKFHIGQELSTYNFNIIREKVINYPEKQKTVVDYSTSIFVHFTYCSSMKTFSSKFHLLWEKYFAQSPIADIIPIVGVRNVHNLQRRLMHTRQVN